MIVNGEKVERITIQGERGGCIVICDSPMGGLKVTEVGKYTRNLLVIPSSCNSIILKTNDF